MNVGLEELNLHPETQKRVVPYCKNTFGNAAPTLKLPVLSGMRYGMLPTFPKRQGGGLFHRYCRCSLDCGYQILWQACQFRQGGALRWIRYLEYNLLVNMQEQIQWPCEELYCRKGLGRQDN